MVAHARAARQNKRHGKHQKHTKHYLKVYLPYLPLLVIIVVGLVFSTYWQPRIQSRGVLAYATSMSRSDLLGATNQQRLNNGVGGLTTNGQLEQAAQAKANDMAARDYWSHNTPEGNPPWVFVDQAGYSYKTAGENLAYGFMTSSDSVAGWMNSPSHRENLLNNAFVDVGFGFANVSNYQSNEPQTIVVALYGTPKAASVPAPAANTPSTQGASQKVAAAEAPATQPKPQSKPQPTTAVEPQQPAHEIQPVTTQTALTKEPPIRRVSRLQTLTNGSLPWLASAVSLLGLLAGALFVLRHGLALRKLFLKGERYVLHHVVFDITIISLIGLCLVVSQTAGFTR